MSRKSCAHKRLGEWLKAKARGNLRATEKVAVSYPGVGRFRRAETGTRGRAKGARRSPLFYSLQVLPRR